MPDYVIGIKAAGNLQSLDQAAQKIAALEKELADLRKQTEASSTANDQSADGIKAIAEQSSAATEKTQELRENLKATATEAARAGTEIKQALGEGAGAGDNFNYDDVFQSIFSESGLQDAKSRINELDQSTQELGETGGTAFLPMAAGALRFLPVAAAVTAALKTAKDSLTSFAAEQEKLARVEDISLLNGLDPEAAKAFSAQVSTLSRELTTLSGVARSTLTDAFLTLTEEGLDPSALDTYANGLTNLIRQTGGDATRSTAALTAALNGNFQAFEQLGIVTDDTLDNSSRLEQAFERLQRRSDTLSGSSQTIAQGWERMSNAASSSLTSLGQLINNTLGVDQALKGVAYSIEDVNNLFSSGSDATTKLADEQANLTSQAAEAAESQQSLAIALANSQNQAAFLESQLNRTNASLAEMIAAQATLNRDAQQLQLSQIDADAAAGVITALEAEQRRAQLKISALDEERKLEQDLRTFQLESSKARINSLLEEQRQLQANAQITQRAFSQGSADPTIQNTALLELKQQRDAAAESLSAFLDQQGEVIEKHNQELIRLDQINRAEQQRNALLQQRNQLDAERTVDSAATREAQAIATEINRRETLDPTSAAASQTLVRQIQETLARSPDTKFDQLVAGVTQSIRAIGSGSVTEAELDQLETSLRALAEGSNSSVLRQLVARVDAIQAQSAQNFDPTAFRDRAAALAAIGADQGVDPAIVQALDQAATQLSGSPDSRDQFLQALQTLADAIRSTQAIDPADTNRILDNLPNAADQLPDMLEGIRRAVDQNIQKNTQAAAIVDQLGNTISSQLANVSNQLNSSLTTLNNRLQNQQDQITQLRRRGTIS